MHAIEPFYNWMHLYTAEEDEQSPFYGIESSEFEFSQTVYNYYIHPQWNDFGSKTLYLKILFVDYDQGFAIIEFIGEWNDAVENDIMTLKSNVINALIQESIYKFILITENVMNFHASDNSYYEEWAEDIKDEGGWIVMLNMPQHSYSEIKDAGITQYVFLQEYIAWRTHLPTHLYQLIDDRLLRILS
jgi:hypothetical protein